MAFSLNVSLLVLLFVAVVALTSVALALEVSLLVVFVDAVALPAVALLAVALLAVLFSLDVSLLVLGVLVVVASAFGTASASLVGVAAPPAALLSSPKLWRKDQLNAGVVLGLGAGAAVVVGAVVAGAVVAGAAVVTGTAAAVEASGAAVVLGAVVAMDAVKVVVVVVVVVVVAFSQKWWVFSQKSPTKGDISGGNISGASSLNGRIVNWFNGRITEQLGLYRIYLDGEKTWVSFMVIPPPLIFKHPLNETMV